MAIIKSGATTDQWTIDPVSKAGRVTLYDTSGSAISTFPVSIVSPPSDIFGSGTISSNGASVSVSTQGSSTVVFNATGTWVGTLQPQVQLGDNSWVNTTVFPTLPLGEGVSTITANGQWKINVGGFKAFRVLSTAWTSGTATLNLEASAGQTFIQTLLRGNNADTLDATPGSAVPTNAIYIGGTDGTNIRGIATDTNGQVKVLIQNTSVNSNVNQVAGVTLGATAVVNYGSTPAAVAVPAVNAFITNSVTVSGTVAATQSGNWTTRIVGNTGATLDAAPNATAPANALVAGGVFNATAPTLTSGNANPLQLDSASSLFVNTQGRRSSYRAAFRAFTPIASATSPMLVIVGSATKTIRITRIRYSSTAATGGVADLILERFSTITGGTINATATAGLLDTNDPAATAVIRQYSVVPATATASGGPMSVERYETVTASVSVPVPAMEWDFGDKNTRALVLRGTSDFIGIMISAVGTTPLADFWLEWTEE